LVGKTSLRELVKCISSCDLFVGMDTSGLHIAISKAVPSIGICGGGHFGRFVPWGDPGKHFFVTREMECFNCMWRCKTGSFECIQAVVPSDVAKVIKNLFKIYD
jgi:ADP-heptose:LPS heptosyltransferase